MIIEIENIGKLKHAKVELKGITTIGGANDTGKSTVGKVLFALTHGFYQLEPRIEGEKISKLLSLFRDGSIHDDPIFYTDAYKKVQFQQRQPQNFNAFTRNLIEYCKDYQVALGEEVSKICNFSKEEIAMEFIGSKFREEFGSQISNFNSNDESTVKFISEKNTKTLKILENQLISIDNVDDLNSQVAFIDDPYILDSLSQNQLKLWNDHRQQLMNQLCNKRNNEENILSKIETKKRLELIMSLINPICRGELEESSLFEYNFKLISGKTIELKNISAGIKTFIIIKTLLQQGALGKNSILILDEPEVHLHPEWQLIFAELIVLLQKEFKLQVLLTTHSPYFLEAIEVYTVKHGISQQCKFYLAENHGDNATLKDVTNQVDIIYNLLAKPLQILENEGVSNEESD